MNLKTWPQQWSQKITSVCRSTDGTNEDEAFPAYQPPTWRFWLWPSQIGWLRGRLAIEKVRSAAVKHSVAELRRIKELEAEVETLRARYQREPRILTEAERTRSNLERLLALAGVGPSNPVWKTVLSYADEHAANEQESALKPDLVNDVRQYNAGRAAGALDFALALRELHAQAQREAKKMESRDA